MSFHCVLPSNSSTVTYPHNCASQYTTPVANSNRLEREWEVALMRATCANDIYSFNNDVMLVEEKIDSNTIWKEVTRPVKVFLTLPTSTTEKDAAVEVSKEINQRFQGVVKMILNKNISCGWKMLRNDCFLVLSESVMVLFYKWSNVITPWDPYNDNYHHFGKFRKPLPNDPNDFYIIVVPVNYKRKDIILKEENEVIDAQTLAQRFNERFPSDLGYMELQRLSHTKWKCSFHKYKTDLNVVIFSPKLVRAVNYRTAGISVKDVLRFFQFKTHTMKSKWYVSVYYLPIIECELCPPLFTRKIMLKPMHFNNHKDAIAFVNEQVKDERITFSSNEKNFVKLTIAHENITVKFSDTLRDIFAFEKNNYSSRGEFTSDDVFSLTRRINFLYIYSSIGDYVRIGNTKAPLLGIIPFQSNKNDEVLTEYVFENPSYVPLLYNDFSKIDVMINDGAGEVVPFVKDSITLICLHFRQK